MNFCVTLVLSLFVSAGVAGQDGRADAPRERAPDRSPPGSGASAGPATDILGCVHSLRDAQGGPCIQASSTATQGDLFPYPGLDNTFSAFSVIPGGVDNLAVGVVCTVGGGSQNRAWSYFSTVAGGIENEASGYISTVGGGFDNEASFYFSSVGGGRSNSASGAYASVSGGAMCSAQSLAATVSGGQLNVASGTHAAVPGGEANRAAGAGSLAAGKRARAEHAGSFVWGDSFDGDKPSSAADEFNVYASGGTRIFSDTAAGTGVLLAPGAGSWTSVSDRAAKENVEPVDTQAVLRGVVDLPVSTWNYRTQDASVRHMGPMAQDFHGAFGLGVGQHGIDTVDPDGVALAAIQGLYARLEEQLARRDEEIARLRSRLEELEARGAAPR